MASTSATAPIVVVPLSGPIAIVIMVVIHVACCYLIHCIRVIVAALATLLLRVGVKLIFSINVTLSGSPMAPRGHDGVFSISPLICQAHEMVDCLWLATSELLLEVTSDEPIPKSVNGSLERNIFHRVAEADPS
jgi:hypothetical protein